MRILHKHVMLAIALFVATGFIPSVFAAGEGMYMGLQVGQANTNNQPELVNTGQSILDPNVPCDSQNHPETCLVVMTTPDTKGLAERLFVGANMNKFFGFEVGLTNYTPASYEPNVEGFTHEPHIWQYSADIMLKAMLPLNRFAIFLKGGVGFVYSSPSAAIDFPDGEDNSTTLSIAPAYGAGVSVDLTPNWEIDFSGNRIKGTSQTEDIDFAAIGISYHFVTEYCGQFLC